MEEAADIDASMKEEQQVPDISPEPAVPESTIPEAVVAPATEGTYFCDNLVAMTFQTWRRVKYLGVCRHYGSPLD